MSETHAARVRELNATVRYTMWSVFRASAPLSGHRDRVAAEVDALFEQLYRKDVVVRGTYDLAGQERREVALVELGRPVQRHL